MPQRGVIVPVNRQEDIAEFYPLPTVFALAVGYFFLELYHFLVHVDVHLEPFWVVGHAISLVEWSVDS
jgi:hypothetical protein